MTRKTLQQSKVGKIQNSPLQSPNSRKYAAVRTREYLLLSEIEAMRDALKKAGVRLLFISLPKSLKPRNGKLFQLLFPFLQGARLNAV